MCPLSRQNWPKCIGYQRQVSKHERRQWIASPYHCGALNVLHALNYIGMQFLIDESCILFPFA